MQHTPPRGRMSPQALNVLALFSVDFALGGGRIKINKCVGREMLLNVSPIAVGGGGGNGHKVNTADLLNGAKIEWGTLEED
jgi:hypothetical protein